MMKKRIKQKYPYSNRYTVGESKGRDNCGYYNTHGRSMATTTGIDERVPSLKRNKKAWENFYKIFPYVKEFLMSMGKEGFCVGQTPVRVTLKGNVYTVVDERCHGHYWKNDVWFNGTPTQTIMQNPPRRGTMKFKKVW